MKSFNILISALIILFVTSCDPTDNRLTIVNETERPLFFTTSAYDTIEGKSPFQAFLDITNNDSSWVESDYFIKPNGEKRKMVMTDWEEIIENNFGGKFYVFIFDADTLQKYNWEQIKKNNNYFAKYGLTLNDLENMNWKIRVK